MIYQNCFPVRRDNEGGGGPSIHFSGVERSSISLCRRSEQAQWFFRELIYSFNIHPQKYNPLNILNLCRF